MRLFAILITDRGSVFSVSYEEPAPAGVSKDGHKLMTRGHGSRRPPSLREGGLLTMRAEGFSACILCSSGIRPTLRLGSREARGGLLGCGCNPFWEDVR